MLIKNKKTKKHKNTKIQKYKCQAASQPSPPTKSSLFLSRFDLHSSPIICRHGNTCPQNQLKIVLDLDIAIASTSTQSNPDLASRLSHLATFSTSASSENLNWSYISLNHQNLLVSRPYQRPTNRDSLNHSKLARCLLRSPLALPLPPRVM